MGYLLKEALKTLCGINQWSYAVFWKFGGQDTKLLTWEECYYEPASCYVQNGIWEIPRQDYSSSSVLPETLNLRSGVHEVSKVHLLVNKMMVDSRVNVVGEGLVGRVALNGNHQWILSENYYRETHPPEVLKEICLQFSAGMQTVALVPVLPHGVAQFGSYSTIAENNRFVSDVVSLICELGCIPGVLKSANHGENELASKSVLPQCPGYSTPQELPLESNSINSSSFFTGTLNHVSCSAQTSSFDSHIPLPLAGEVQNEMQSSIAPFQASDSYHLKPSQANKLDFSFPNQSMDGQARAEVIHSCSIPRIRTSSGLVSSCSDNGVMLLSGEANKLRQVISSNIKPIPVIDSLSGDNKVASAISIHTTPSGLKKTTSSKIETTGDTCFDSRSGDDLFDILGADFKEKWLGNGWRSRSRDESAIIMHKCDTNDSSSINNLASSEIYHTTQRKSDSRIGSFTDTNHLLDAVVSKAHPFAKQSLNGDVSCKTTLNNAKRDLLAVPNYTTRADVICSSSLSTASLKEDSGIYSQGSSLYDPWIERGNNTRRSNSATTGYSTKPHEPSKTNRKRLKPGENPRPRPKDRQMIQDRVKELREIVPNGAKCSIDALLERTIKHMLFLQSVTKHADKLKQTAESKTISKDDGLLLKDNLGGATWAYEVGSQSMMCPIIVEDLNLPHQMLVEMLCEERGLFLEIADIIRALGLTILKGLMETRNDKIWARFTVEANRNVTRMEIFLSLVRLLEQNAKPDAPQSNNVMVQEASQAAFV